MQRALDLAWRGWGRVHPNPLVGAVILAGDLVVGEGWHAEYGHAHAELAALDQAGERARGGTLVVTLEPCNHEGKQPPCVGAILAAGIRRVVIALADPNPVARGGADRLKSAGVEVEIGLQADDVARQNAIFLHQFRHSERPFIALKLATSLDACIADASGLSRWISGPAARDYVHWLRAGFGAIGVGGHTALVDDPSLTVRGPLEPRVQPLRVVFDRSGGLSEVSSLVRTAREHPVLLVIHPDALRLEAVRRLETHGVELVPAPTLPVAFEALRSRGVQSIVIEGGGKIGGALLGENLVDRFHWIQSPVWLGERGVPATRGWVAPPLAGSTRWTVVQRRALEQDTLLVVDRE